VSDEAKNLFGATRQLAALCSAQLREVEAAHEIDDPQAQDQALQDSHAYLAVLLSRAIRSLALVYETLSLPNALTVFREEMAPFNLEEVAHYDGQAEYPYSPALDHLTSHLTTLEPIIGEVSTVQQERQVLRRMLEQLPASMTARDFTPARELDVQAELHRILQTAFPDVVRDPPAAKQTKIYKPDFGIESISTAIEVKYLDAKARRGDVLGELYEDMHGYAGNPEWSLFVGLIYQTGPWLSQQVARAEGKKAGIPKSWVLLVVTGAGDAKSAATPKAKAKKSAPPKPAE